MTKKIYVLSQGFNEINVLEVSTDKTKLQRYVDAIRKRNSNVAQNLAIIGFTELDDTYLNNMPEEPIYHLQYDISENKFLMDNESVCQLSYFEEEDFVFEHGENDNGRWLIQYDSNIIEVYVRANDIDEASKNAQLAVDEYLNERNDM